MIKKLNKIFGLLIVCSVLNSCSIYSLKQQFSVISLNEHENINKNDINLSNSKIIKDTNISSRADIFMRSEKCRINLTKMFMLQYNKRHNTDYDAIVYGETGVFEFCVPIPYSGCSGNLYLNGTLIELENKKNTINNFNKTKELEPYLPREKFSVISLNNIKNINEKNLDLTNFVKIKEEVIIENPSFNSNFKDKKSEYIKNYIVEYNEKYNTDYNAVIDGEKGLFEYFCDDENQTLLKSAIKGRCGYYFYFTGTLVKINE